MTSDMVWSERVGECGCCGGEFMWWLSCAVHSTVAFVFLFQAEDGIRDLVRSRGLGDVYKRQLQDHVAQTNATLYGARSLLCWRRGSR